MTNAMTSLITVLGMIYIEVGVKEQDTRRKERK